MMNKFEQLWIMPPLYHRVFDFLTRTTVQSRQEYSYEALARFVGWYDEDDWTQPSVSQVTKILDWLNDNEFIIFEKGEGYGKITIIWKHMKMRKPMSESEYNNAYSAIFTDMYKELTGKDQITTHDVEAIYELSANNVSIKKATDVMKNLVEKVHVVPSVTFVKDYVFADICYEMACR